MSRQVVTDGSGDAVQLVERRASNRKVAKPWLDTECSSAWRVLKKDA